MVRAIYTKKDRLLVVEHTLNSVRSGLQWVWDMDNSMLMEESSYKSGKEHGIMRAWYPNGTLRTERYCFRGLAECVSRKYHPNGMTLCETFWSHGYKHGVERYWDVSGELYKETAYRKGVPYEMKSHTNTARVDMPFYKRDIREHVLSTRVQEEKNIELNELPRQSYYEAAFAASATLRIKLASDTMDHNEIRSMVLGLNGTN